MLYINLVYKTLRYRLASGQSMLQLELERKGFASSNRRSLGTMKVMKMISKQLATLKPPNVLVCSSSIEESIIWKDLMSRIFVRDRYTIYDIKLEDLTRSPWDNNTALLILDQLKSLSDEHYDCIDRFVDNGGSLLSHGSYYPRTHFKTTSAGTLNVSSRVTEVLPIVIPNSAFSEKVTKLHVWNTLLKETCFEGSEVIGRLSSESKAPVISFGHQGQGKIVCSIVNFLITSTMTESNQEIVLIDDVLKHVFMKLEMTCQNASDIQNKSLFSPAILASKSSSLLDRFFVNLDDNLVDGLCNGKDFSLHFGSSEKVGGLPASPEFLPVIVCESRVPTTTTNFDFSEYWHYLTSTTLGNIAMYTDVIASTQFVFEKVPPIQLHTDGLIVVAQQQTHGKGRGGNSWLSPAGCMMFSLHVSIPLRSNLGHSLPYLQHIAAVSMVKAVRDIPGYQDINIRIKWPNDIYFDSSTKLGGIIVNSSCFDGHLKAVIGMGVNISNEKPTACVNEVISQYNEEHGATLEPLSIEKVLALTVSNIEKYLDEFEKSGYKTFCSDYYEYWLHDGAKIHIGSEDGEQVTVQGLDSDGFLLVKTQAGKCISLQPDGNSFDMMRGLITVKNR